jgi:toxin ParE1/3/4
MARRVVWSYEAVSDLEALAEYIAKDSHFYAAAFVREIRDASRSLNRLAERGRIVSEIVCLPSYIAISKAIRS